MKPGPSDRPLLYLLAAINAAMLVALPVGAYCLWNFLGADAVRAEAGRFRPIVLLVALIGQILLTLRLRRLWSRIRAI